MKHDRNICLVRKYYYMLFTSSGRDGCFQGLITCMCPTLGTKLIKFVSCFAFSGRQLGFPGVEDDWHLSHSVLTVTFGSEKLTARANQHPHRYLNFKKKTLDGWPSKNIHSSSIGFPHNSLLGGHPDPLGSLLGFPPLFFRCAYCTPWLDLATNCWINN